MRMLYLVRHAKSSWSDMTLEDFDRPLNKRGKRDAPVMAKWLIDHIETLDYIMSSPAKRAKKTAQEFAKVFDLSINFHKSLYHAGSDEIYSSIYSTDDDFMQVALFGHNPGFTYFANEYSGDDHIENVPTCGIVAIKSTCTTWKEFSTDNSEVAFFIYPKKLNLS